MSIVCESGSLTCVESDLLHKGETHRSHVFEHHKVPVLHAVQATIHECQKVNACKSSPTLRCSLRKIPLGNLISIDLERLFKRQAWHLAHWHMCTTIKSFTDVMYPLSRDNAPILSLDLLIVPRLVPVHRCQDPPCIPSRLSSWREFGF